MELKQNPEDFIVHEIIDLDKKPGDYLYVEITKKDLNTQDVINEIARILNIQKRSIGFAGNKDKRAITTQYFSLYKVRKDLINKIKINNVRIIPLHYGSRPIFLGALIGNHFKIKYTRPIRGRIRLDNIVNYYGEQRFSSNNKDIGKALLERDFKKACSLINNDKVNNYIKRKSDFIGALRLIDRSLLSLYINAFQAYLWNEVAKRFIKENYKHNIEFEGLYFVEKPRTRVSIPLISFNTKIKNKTIKHYYLDLLRKEGIRFFHYNLPEFSNLISKTSFRPLFTQVKDFRISKDYIEFELPKGSFATIFIKNLEALNNTIKG